MKRAALCIWLASAVPAAAQQYDLACVGTRQTVVDGPAMAHTYGFRVDLTAGRWCWEHCERTFAIAEVAPERLLLASERREDRRGSYLLENAINRTDGTHEMVSISTTPPPMFTEIKGRCERRPFSGFPQAQF